MIVLQGGEQSVRIQPCRRSKRQCSYPCLHGPVFMYSTFARFRHFATVLGLTPVLGTGARAKHAIAVLLLGQCAWSWRFHAELFPHGILPFQR